MDYEKKYQEALSRARSIIEDYKNRGLNDILSYAQEDLSAIFPELEMSEDESIIRDIRVVLESSATRIFKENGQMPVWYDRAVAWLEKQGEQNPVFEMKTPEESLGVDSDTYNKIVDECIYGEQNPAWSEEDETTKNNISHIISQYDKISKRENQPCYYVGDCLLWMQYIKDRVQPQPKQEWSNWDKTIIESIEALCDEKIESVVFQDVKEHVNDIKDWLKSIKDRVQPKQEWSEEDGDIRDNIIRDLKRLSGDMVSPNQTYQKEIQWLKSLRPQNWTKEDKERYVSCLQRLGTGNPKQPETINSKWFKEHVYPQSTWKPSDEEMKALADALSLANNCGEENAFDLRTLYEQLKKIREE